MDALEQLSNVRMYNDPCLLVLSMVSEVLIKLGKPPVRCDDLKTDRRHRINVLSKTAITKRSTAPSMSSGKLPGVV